MKPGLDYIGVTTPFYCVNSKGQILLAKRSTEARDEIGNWDPGSGQLEFGLSVEDNIMKEMKEEYNAQGEILAYLPAHSIFRTFEGKKTHWIAVPRFILVTNENEVKINEPHKFTGIGWFYLDELPEPLHTGFSHTLNTYRQEFENFIRKKPGKG